MKKRLHYSIKYRITPKRNIFLEGQPEAPAISLPAQPDIKPIHHERVEKDLKEARIALQYVSDEVQQPVIADLSKKLNEIEKKYEKISTDAPLKILEKEVYAELEPILLKAAQRELKNCKKILQPRFEKQGMVFTFENEKITAILDDHYDIASVKIEGVTINFFDPIKLEVFDQQSGKPTVLAARRIIQRFQPGDLKVDAARGRYEFSIAEKGQQRKFVATSEDLLEIKEEVSPQKQAQFPVMNRRYNILKKGLKKQIDKLRELFKDKQEILTPLTQLSDSFSNNTIEIDQLYAMKDIEKKSFSPDQNLEWAKFSASMQGFLPIHSAWNTLREECTTRKLQGINEQGEPINVKEYADPSNPKYFHWTYLDKEGVETKQLGFHEGKCFSRKKIENGKCSQITYLKDDGSIQSEWSQDGIEDWYAENGLKNYRSIYDPKNLSTLVSIQFYDDEGKLLDNKALEEMPIVKLERLLLGKMEKSRSMSQDEIDKLCKACFCAAEYIKYCPRGKEVLMKAARLNPYYAFSYFEKYKGNLYAMDMLEEAASKLKPDTIKEFLDKNSNFANLTTDEKKSILDSKNRKNPNFSSAKTFLEEEEGSFLSLDVEERERISSFMKDPALKNLSKIQAKWLEPHWYLLKKPVAAQTEKQVLKWKTGVLIMIARNLNFKKMEVTRNNVEKEFFRIAEMKEKYENVRIFAGRNVLVAANNQLLSDLRDNDNKPYPKEYYKFWQKESGDLHRFGKIGLQEAIKKQQIGNESFEMIRPENDHESLEDAKKNILKKLATTPVPMTFLFDGHGDDWNIHLNQLLGPDTQMGASGKTPGDVRISAVEFANALIARFKNFPQLETEDPHKKDVLVFTSCSSSNFIRAVYGLCGNIPKPISLLSSEYGQLGYSSFELKTGSHFSAQVLGLEESTSTNPITIGDVCEAELCGDTNPTMYIGNEKNTLMQIARNEKTVAGEETSA